MTNLTTILSALAVLASACAAAEQPSVDELESRWTYSVDYLDHEDMSVISSQSGPIGDGAQSLHVDHWDGLAVSTESIDVLGRAYRETTIDGQQTPIMQVTCGVAGGVGQSYLTVGTRIAVLTVRCAD